MPQSLSEILIHAVFSTKDRKPLIPSEFQLPLHAFLAGVCRKAGCEGLRVGGVADHVHLAVRLSRTITAAELIEELKTASSKWIKTQAVGLSRFHWPRGYGVFSIGYSNCRRCYVTLTRSPSIIGRERSRRNTEKYCSVTRLPLTSVMCGTDAPGFQPLFA